MSTALFSGDELLESLLVGCAGYHSVVAAVARHTWFLHPDTVRQTNGSPLFATIRYRPKERERPGDERNIDGRRVLLDDNWSPIHAFDWAARRSTRSCGAHVNHIWKKSHGPSAYTALWNLRVTPAFLANATDSSDEVIAALRFRSYNLYRVLPPWLEQAPERPPGYDRLGWADPHPPTPDLRDELYRRLARCRGTTNVTRRACRNIGWYFSEWKPDGRFVP
jgi:hypothetical protein